MRAGVTKFGLNSANPHTSDLSHLVMDLDITSDKRKASSYACSLLHTSTAMNGVFLLIYLLALVSILCNGFVLNTAMETSISKLPISRSTLDLSASSQDIISTPIVCTAAVDYSAVNEYVKAHYQIDHYFDHDRVQQQIYDGRVLQSHYEDERRMLRDSGLAIPPSPLHEQINWSNVQDIKQSYIPHLEKIIHDIFPNLMGYCFWNPMVRGESLISTRDERSKTPTANIAPMVHIDTDIGAFDLKEFLDIVDKNSVHQSTTIETSESFMQMAERAVESNKRFLILNFWRNIGDDPVSSAPLTILSTRYDSSALAFPDARPSKESKWFMFPNATRDEVIVFFQYDRNMMQVSDLFHCAIATNNNTMGDGRKSFDIRVLIVLNEDVPDELDRYKQRRTRPVLSFEESGCFCDEQAEQRKGGK